MDQAIFLPAKVQIKVYFSTMQWIHRICAYKISARRTDLSDLVYISSIDLNEDQTAQSPIYIFEASIFQTWKTIT